MSANRARRIDEGLSALVDNILPTIGDEDEDEADVRHENALELARSIIDRYHFFLFSQRLVRFLHG